MPEVEIRSAVKEDLLSLVAIRHDYQSLYVWQMEHTVTGSEITVNFHQVRLPHPLKVQYGGRHPILNAENWSRYQAVLVALVQEEVVGYIALSDQILPKTIWVTDCAVHGNQRRKGIGMALHLAAEEWGQQNGFMRCMLEIESKNSPAIQLARKLNYEFCGYNDHYSVNQDIVLFFARSLR